MTKILSRDQWEPIPFHLCYRIKFETKPENDENKDPAHPPGNTGFRMLKRQGRGYGRTRSARNQPL